MYYLSIVAFQLVCGMFFNLSMYIGGLDNDSHPIVMVLDIGLRGFGSESYEKFCTILQYFRTLMKCVCVCVCVCACVCVHVLLIN